MPFVLSPVYSLHKAQTGTWGTNPGLQDALKGQQVGPLRAETLQPNMPVLDLDSATEYLPEVTRHTHFYKDTVYLTRFWENHVREHV